MLEGKHALITGGGTGIGLAIARTLAQHGARVTITGRRADILKGASSARIFAMTLDVRDEDAQKEQIAHAVDLRGPIQICVANAGIAEGRKLQKTSSEFWRNMMATNLDGAFFTIRESMQSMLETNWGRVIAISSIAGVRGLKGGGAYAASKHGLIGLIRSYSEEYMGSHMTFNAICPGYVDTPIIEKNLDSIQSKGFSKDQAMDMMVSANPNKRLIPPQDIADAALWLCGEGSANINGQTLEIAGGQV